MSSVLGLVLAAGRSSRAGFPKALARLDGETLVARAVRGLREAGCGCVVVVVAAPHDEAVAAAVADCVIAKNPEPERGMTSSLQVGLEAGLGALPDASAVVFALVDHPRVAAGTIASLVAARERGDLACVRPTHGGRGGHPVVMARRVADALRVVASSTVLSDALRAEGGVESLTVDDPNVAEDLDTAADLAGAGVLPPENQS